MIFKPNPLKYWFTLIFAKPGQGKSLEQARLSEKLMREYFFIEKKYPTLPHRILMTNQYLNYKEFKIDRRIDSQIFCTAHIVNWEKPEEFRYCPRADCFKTKEKHDIHDVDIFIDEGATLFPADQWKDTPGWLRKLWLQHRHNGIRVLCLTQNYMQIDINCRRVFQGTYYMHKWRFSSRDISATLPPVKTIYGVYSKRMIDPEIMEGTTNMTLVLKTQEDHVKKLEEIHLIGMPEYHLITRHKINLYDTTQNVKEYSPIRILEHSEAKCEDPTCELHTVGKVFHKLK